MIKNPLFNGKSIKIDGLITDSQENRMNGRKTDERSLTDKPKQEAGYDPHAKEEYMRYLAENKEVPEDRQATKTEEILNNMDGYIEQLAALFARTEGIADTLFGPTITKESEEGPVFNTEFFFGKFDEKNNRIQAILQHLSSNIGRLEQL